MTPNYKSPTGGWEAWAMDMLISMAGQRRDVVAKAIGCSINAVVGMRHRTRHPLPPKVKPVDTGKHAYQVNNRWQQWAVDRVKELWDTHSKAKIAEEIGCTINALTGMTDREAFPIKGKPLVRHDYGNQFGEGYARVSKKTAPIPCIVIAAPPPPSPKPPTPAVYVLDWSIMALDRELTERDLHTSYLLGRTPLNCDYPIGAVGSLEFRFCDADAVDRVYCAEHRAICNPNHVQSLDSTMRQLDRAERRVQDRVL